MTTPNRFRFRAWDNKRMRMWKSAGVFLVRPDGMPLWILGDAGEDVSEAPHLILMQSTGLVDARGVEVFEGDIVRTPLWSLAEGDEPADSSSTSVVVFDGGAYRLEDVTIGGENVYKRDRGEWMPLLYDCEDSWKVNIPTIIGNIHQHPHLLRK